MLDLISVKNFKSLRELQFRLGRLAVLAGPNSAGKTSILQAVHAVCEVVRKTPSGLFREEWSPAVLRTHGVVEPIELYSTVRDPEAYIVVTISEAPKESNHRWVFACSSNEERAYPEAVPNLPAGKNFPTLRKRFPVSALVRFDPIRLAAPSLGAFPIDQVDPDGGGLATVLATMKATSEDDFTFVQSGLAEIVPSIKRIELAPMVSKEKERQWFEAASGEEGFREVETERRGFKISFAMANGAVVPAYAASEGVLLTLALLTMLCSRARPDLLLLDNVERGLHPRALRDLVGKLRVLLDRFPKLQIVATTHSPYMLDWIEPDEIQLVSLNETGHTVIGPLTGHPEFARWREEMLPGEFWSMVGEQWLLKRPPVEAQPA